MIRRKGGGRRKKETKEKVDVERKKNEMKTHV